jgi:hypothetical protein
MNESDNASDENAAAQPWWKFGHMWLVAGLPAAVVVAGFAMLFVAMRSPDPVLGPEGARRPAPTAQSMSERAWAPALQGRNHAATPAAAH